MKKSGTAIALVLSVMLTIPGISPTVYADKSNDEYIVFRRKENHAKFDMFYSWGRMYSQDEANTITLYWRRRLPPEESLIVTSYIGDPSYEGTVTVPDQIYGNTVTGVQGSCSAVGYDVNPENPYMECINNVIFSKDKKTLMSYPQNKSDTSYIIPDETETVGEFAFSYTSFLNKITIPESVNRIERGAFTGSRELTEIVFEPGNSGLYIGPLAFAFHKDNYLTELKLPGFNVEIDGEAFDINVPKLTSYEQPAVKTENKIIIWDKIPNTSYYEIYQKLKSGEYKKIGKTKANKWKPSGLREGKEYTFAIKPIAVIPAANLKGKDKNVPVSFTVEGTMSEDITVVVK